IDYHAIELKGGARAGEKVLIAEPLIEDFIKRVGADGFKVLLWMKGAALAGATARHPMHHLGGFFATPRPLLEGDFVTTDSGTGLVH
ncbi:hypothetical protein ABTM19_20490, partial [Acinetobacter baumannii]